MSINHIVIIVKENHTFDNYFGTFSGTEGSQLPQAPNPPGFDPDHKHRTWMKRMGNTQYEEGYREEDIPGYFFLARNFTLCSRYFSEVAGPSTPNHLMLIAADAPIIENPKNHYRPNASAAYSLRSLPEVLEKEKLTWGNFGGYAFKYINGLDGHSSNHKNEEFEKFARAGNLPNVSWVYGEPFSEHAEKDASKGNITEGSQWTLKQIQAIIDGGLWNKTMIIITWDDWGGWYDHVDPPVVEKWNPSMAQNADEAFPDYNGDPFRYGSRVPCLVVGPYAKAGHLSKELNSHVSVVGFCQQIFGLPEVHSRATKSNCLGDCVDRKQTPLPPPDLSHYIGS